MDNIVASSIKDFQDTNRELFLSIDSNLESLEIVNANNQTEVIEPLSENENIYLRLLPLEGEIDIEKLKNFINVFANITENQYNN